MQALVMVCDSTQIDTATGQCSHPYWMAQQTLIPPLDAAAGIAIGLSILTCWGMAFAFKSIQRVGD